MRKTKKKGDPRLQVDKEVWSPESEEGVVDVRHHMDGDKPTRPTKPRRLKLSDFDVSWYAVVVLVMAAITVLLQFSSALDDYSVAARIFVLFVNLASPGACLWFAVQTKRTDIDQSEFTIHTTTIRSVLAAWIGFFLLAFIHTETSINLEPQLDDLFALAAVTSLLALCGPAYSELTNARRLQASSTPGRPKLAMPASQT